MSKQLQTPSMPAWENRTASTAPPKGEVGRYRSGDRRLDDDRSARRENRRRMDRESMLKKACCCRFGCMICPDGGGASLPAWARALVDKVRSRRRLGTPLVRQGRLPRRRARSCAALLCRASVVLMPSFVISAPTSIRAPWSIPGRPSARAPRSARTAISRAASASAACSSPCRPIR